MSFAEELDKYLTIRDKVKAEEKKGVQSKYWTDEYGWGASSLHDEFKEQAKKLNKAIFVEASLGTVLWL